MCLFFHAASPIPVGPSAAGLVTADINADGLSDIVVVDNTGKHLVVLTGNGQGGFAAEIVKPLPSTASSLIAATDHSAVAAIGTTGGIETLQPDGHGGIKAITGATLPSGTNLLAAVGPGLTSPIFVATEETSTLRLLGASDGNVVTLPAPPSALAAGVGDGLPFAVAVGNGNAFVVRADAAGHLGHAQTYIVPGGNPAVVTADVNGDGRPDIVTATPVFLDFPGVSYTTQVSVLLNNGHGGFDPASVTTLQEGEQVFPYTPALAPLKLPGSKAVDIVVADPTGVYVLLPGAHGSFRSQQAVYYVNYFSGTSYGVPVAVTTATLRPGASPDIVVSFSSGYVQTFHVTSVVHDGTRPLVPLPLRGLDPSGMGITLGLGLALVVRGARAVRKPRTQPLEHDLFDHARSSQK